MCCQSEPSTWKFQLCKKQGSLWVGFDLRWSIRFPLSQNTSRCYDHALHHHFWGFAELKIFQIGVNREKPGLCSSHFPRSLQKVKRWRDVAGCGLDKKNSDVNKKTLPPSCLSPVEQTWTPGRGTSRPRSVPCGPTSSASTAGATTRTTATRTSCPWTTACRASWDSGWTCPRTLRWTTTSGWSARSSPSPSRGRSCSSEGRRARPSALA